MNAHVGYIGVALAGALVSLAGCGSAPLPPYDFALNLSSVGHRSPRFVEYCKKPGEQARIVHQGNYLWYYRCVAGDDEQLGGTPL